MITEPALTKIKIKTRRDFEATGDPDSAVDRYLIDSVDSGGLIAVVEQEWHRGCWRRRCTSTAEKTNTPSCSRGASASSPTATRISRTRRPRVQAA